MAIEVGVEADRSWQWSKTAQGRSLGLAPELGPDGRYIFAADY
jgi:hypothetical protein